MPSDTPETAPARLTALLLAVLATGGVSPSKAAAVSRNGFDLDGALVPTREIVEGGPRKDGIPSIDEPKFVPADRASFLEPNDRILGLVIAGVARAYPVRILNYHEIVNDRIAGAPVAVTWCPLCGSGVAFDADVDGQALSFGVSGLLYNSDVLLYDRQSHSLWSQIGRRAITGVYKGRKLEMLPLSHTTWRDWRARHPDSEVLSIDTGFFRDYTVDPYADYRESNRLFFPVRKKSGQYPRKTMVLGVEVDGRYKAYPFPELEAVSGPVRDSVATRSITVIFDAENRTARAVTEDGGDLPTMMTYWFAWYAFHPKTELFRAP